MTVLRAARRVGRTGDSADMFVGAIGEFLGLVGADEANGACRVYLDEKGSLDAKDWGRRSHPRWSFESPTLTLPDLSTRHKGQTLYIIYLLSHSCLGEQCMPNAGRNFYQLLLMHAQEHGGVVLCILTAEHKNLTSIIMIKIKGSLARNQSTAQAGMPL